MPELLIYIYCPFFLDKYCCQDFIEKNGESLVIVEEMHKNMKTLFSEIVEFYCLDPKKTVMEEFFAVVYKFILEYQV